MSEMPKIPKPIPNTVVDLLVSDVLQKNGVNLENAKNKLSDEQKKALKKLVEELSEQVDSFVNKSKDPS